MLNVFKCPHCQKRIETSLEIGDTIACPYCEEEFKLRRSHVSSKNDVGNTVAKFLIPLGYVLFVGVPLAATIGYFALRAQQQEEPAKPAPVVADAEPVVKKPDTQPVRKPRKSRKTGGEGDDPGTPDDPEPLKLVPTKPENTKPDDPKKEVPKQEPEVAIAPEPREIFIAPAPHEVAWKFPLRDFQSKWQTVGAVDVRLAGLATTKVPLVNSKGETQESASAMLVLVVEVRMNTATKNRTLNSWTHGKNHYSTIFTANGKELAHGAIPFGAKVQTGLDPQQTIPSDQTPVRDILVFVPPANDAGQLSLRLDAERCGESGDIWIKIPDSAWKK